MASPVKDAKLKAQSIWPGATIDSRGKGWIKHAHPTEPDRFMLDNQVGNDGWHFGDGDFTEANEVDTAWVDADPVLDAPWLYKMVLADYNAYFAPGSQLFNAGQIIKYDHVGSGESVTFQAQSLNWVNDLDQISQISIAQPITPSSIDDDTIRWNGAYGAGLDFEWQTQTARLSKKLHIDSATSLGTPPQFIIDGGGAALGLKFIFSHSKDIDIYINDVLWNKKSNNPQMTNSNVEFRLNGETLWYFVHPWASDDGGEQPSIITKFTASAQNLFVEVQVPWAWLETAIYPVEIDPTINETVGAGADDGEWEEGGAGAAETANTTHNWNTAPTANEMHFDRWTGISGLSGATIDNAYLEWYFRDTETGMDLTIYFDKQAAPTAITTDADGDGRTKTTASFNWTANIASGNAYQSSGANSLDSVIQEIADSYDPSAMQDISRNESGGTDCRVRTWDSNPAQAAKLHIEYTAAVGGRTTKNTDPQMLGIRAGISRTVNA